MPLTRHLHLFCLPSGRSLLCPSFQFMLSMSAKIICWNCRGISARDTCSRILHFIRKDKPWIICLLETRANDDRVDRFCSKLPRCWEWAAILAEGYSGALLFYGIVGLAWLLLLRCLAGLCISFFLMSLLKFLFFLLFITLIVCVLNALCGLSLIRFLP